MKDTQSLERDKPFGSPQASYDSATCDFGGNTELPILTDGACPSRYVFGPA